MIVDNHLLRISFLSEFVTINSLCSIKNYPSQNYEGLLYHILSSIEGYALSRNYPGKCIGPATLLVTISPVLISYRISLHYSAFLPQALILHRECQ